MLGFNDTLTLVGHFVLSPREREKRDRRDSRGDGREGQGRKRNRNESEETEYKHSPSTLTCYKESRHCPIVSQSQLDALVTQDTLHLRHTRPPSQPETDNCPYRIWGKERMTVENISWSISTKECCETRQGSNQPDHQLDMHPTKPLRLAARELL